MKLVDFDISDWNSKIDTLQKTCQTLDGEADSCILKVEKDIQNSQTLIAKCVAMKWKNGEKKEDITKLGENVIIMGEKCNSL